MFRRHFLTLLLGCAVPWSLFSQGESSLEIIAPPYTQSIELLSGPIKEGPGEAATGGLFYFLSFPDPHSTAQYNPALLGSVGVTASSTAEISIPAYDVLLDTPEQKFFTEDSVGSWWSCELIDSRMSLKAYRVCNSASASGDFIRSWILEASSDGLEWITLSSHSKDEALKGPGDCEIWNVTDTGESYSFFRLRQTGVNSSENERLSFASIELYGTFQSNLLKTPWIGAQTSHEFELLETSDGESATYRGLIDFLQYDSLGKEALRNPILSGILSVTLSSQKIPESPSPTYSFFSQESTTLMTGNGPDQWIEFDLGTSALRLTHYRMQHEPDKGAPPLTDWILEGSNNGQTWVTLQQVDDKTSRESDGSSDYFSPETNSSLPPFSKFRYRVAGASAAENQAFAIYGVDFYGTAYGDSFTDIETLTPTCLESLNFGYVSDFDGNGIVAYFATLGNSRFYQNPALDGRLSVSASSVQFDSEPPHVILGEDVVRFVTQSENNAWVEVDFSPHSITPTDYSLRHYSSYDTEALRDWVLEGSNDGENWIVLRNHVEDTSLDGKGDTKTWPLEGVPSEASYQKFRVRMTGLNSNGHNYLALSGFEIYGTLCLGVQLPAELEAALTFEQDEPFDTNGVIYFLGTSGGATPFLNPVLTGKVSIEASSTLGDSLPVQSILDRESVRFVTSPIRGSSVTIDFKAQRIRPTSYSLQHYSSWDTEALRNWVLEGSNDGESWVLLREHTNDDTLNTKGQWASWITDNPDPNQGYARFRIRQTGPNSNNHYYLALSGFEIYGDLETAEIKPVAPPRGGDGFSYTSDFDGEGIIAHLATNGGRQAYVNPVDLGLADVRASALVADSERAASILGDQVVRCVTAAQPNSWFEIKFPQFAIRPDKYTLRHYSSWDTEALRNWVIEASNDGIVWQALRTHFNDSSLNTRGATASWDLNLDEGAPFYSYFRIRQTGLNSNNHHYLALSGFELYGELAPIDPETDSVDPPLYTQGRLTFEQLDDAPAGGVIEYLATANGTQVRQNPKILGLMDATASSLLADSEPADAILGNQSVRCVTRPVDDSWFEIDFINLKVKPTMYALRHYSSWDSEALRNWELQGSNDGENWTLLRSHTNDTSLQSKGQWSSWSISGSVASFRYFRVFQTGLNSNNHKYLALSGIEIYGALESSELSPSVSFNNWARGLGLTLAESSNLELDSNNDGRSNLEHFAFGTEAVLPAFETTPLIVYVTESGANRYGGFTVAMRAGAAPLFATSPVSITEDGIRYEFSVTPGLQSAEQLDLVEIIPALTEGLPVSLPAGYNYRSFRFMDAITDQPSAFLQIGVSIAP